jgi:hypothetical protein
LVRSRMALASATATPAAPDRNVASTEPSQRLVARRHDFGWRLLLGR